MTALQPPERNTDEISPWLMLCFAVFFILVLLDLSPIENKPLLTAVYVAFGAAWVSRQWRSHGYQGIEATLTWVVFWPISIIDACVTEET